MLPESALSAKERLCIDLSDDHALGIELVSKLLRRNSNSRLLRAPQLEGRGPVSELTFMYNVCHVCKGSGWG